MNEIKIAKYESVKELPPGKSLVLAPHPDDEVFGCGGAILRHIQQGDIVKIVIVTDGGFPVKETQNYPEYIKHRKEESLAAAKIMDYGTPQFLDFPDGSLSPDEKLITTLISIINDFKAQNIYLPAESEIHPDHLALCIAGKQAANKCHRAINLIFYEVGQPLKPNLLHDITDLHDQLEMAMNSFSSQMAVQNYKHHINGLHAFRSYTLGNNVKYAEAYQINKSIGKKIEDTLSQEPQKSLMKEQVNKSDVNTYPLISVIVRTMNRPELPEALHSIAKQTYPNIEVIVVDALGEESLSLGSFCGNSPMRVVSFKRHLTRPEAANIGLNEIKGAYFCFIDEDDLILDFHCEELHSILNKTNAIAAYSNIKRVNKKHETLNVFEEEFNVYKLHWSNYIPFNALMFKTDLVQEECEFDESFEIYEDWDFIIQVAMISSLLHLNKTTGIYVDTNSSGVRNNESQVHKIRIHLLNKWKSKMPKEMYNEFLNVVSQFYLEEKDSYKKQNDELTLDNGRFTKQNIFFKNEILKSHKKAILAKENIINLNKLIADKDQYLQGLYLKIEEKQFLVSKINNSFSWRMTAVFRLSIFHDLKNKILIYRFSNLLKRFSYFDETYYLSNNPDVKKTGIPPIKHYLFYGGFESRNPSDIFNSRHYLQSNPDVREKGINPLFHYLLFGRNENRSCVFSDDFGNPITNSDYQKILDNRIIPPSPLPNKVDYNEMLSILENSDYFNKEYYLNKNKDVEKAKLEPNEHYFHFGWKEKRNPSKNFDNQFYLQTNPDVAKMNINPLIHYLIYGINENRLPKPLKVNEKTSLANADINNIDLSDDKWKEQKVAVVCHLFYLDLAEEVISYLLKIPVPIDLFISTRAEFIERVTYLFNSKFEDAKIVVKSFENKGRDILPFVSFLKNDLLNYDVVCKIHTKRSPHNIHLHGWRNYLFEQLLGGTAPISKILSEFENDIKLGIIWPISYPYLSFFDLNSGWSKESENSRKFYALHKRFPNIEKSNSNKGFEFPTGTMFWFRPKSLQSLIDLNIQIDDFEEENNQLDYTLAHYIERLMPQISNKAGYHFKKSFFSSKMRVNQSKIRQNLPQGSSVLFVTHDLFQAGAQQVLLNILNWMYDHTSFNLYVLALKNGDDGGKLRFSFERVSQLIVWDELIEEHDDKAFDILKEFTGPVDLIYGNSIVSAQSYPFLSKYKAPFITHIHELEKSIQKYTLDKTREIWKQKTELNIACSQPVLNNLIKNHQINSEKINCIHEFIKLSYQTLPNRIHQRKILGLASNKTMVWACGTINWRKATDVFIKVAHTLKERGINDFVFNWIGSNYWYIENDEWGNWSEWEDYIKEHQLEEIINFIPERSNPREYFAAGDIFFLPSREDPFPLVCLEAAECALPIVCFKDAGGIPDLVGSDAGISIPYLDIDKAADAISTLIADDNLAKKLGANAREKVLNLYTDQIALPKILNTCHQIMNTKPLLSVIVPVYNHAGFLEERIESILNQTFRDFEIIILDDFSTDQSLIVAKKYEAHPNIRVIANEVNSGSPFKQWQKGVKLAIGKYIWIAEGDDKTSPEFIQTLIPAFNNQRVKLAYCASHQIDHAGYIEEEHYKKIGHYKNLALPEERWDKEYIEEGSKEIMYALAIRNTIPNVSAVIFEAQAIKSVDFEKAAEYKNGGDWFAYHSILKSGELYYNPAHLNYHRVHSSSVVARNKRLAENTLPDYYKIHLLMVEENSIPEEVISLMIKSVTCDLRNIWPDLSDKEFEKLYDSKLIWSRSGRESIRKS